MWPGVLAVVWVMGSVKVLVTVTVMGWPEVLSQAWAVTAVAYPHSNRRRVTSSTGRRSRRHRLHRSLHRSSAALAVVIEE